MELSFTKGTFVSNPGELNYKQVLEDFQRANTIRILTYNISGNYKNDTLLSALSDTNADIQIITNIPSRMEYYYDSEAGRRMRLNAQKNIKAYISKLNYDNYSAGFSAFFNLHNHAKIIGTENIVYIGSANFSNESAKSIETGVIIEDRAFIRNLYSDFFAEIVKDSLSYYDETFSAFRLFILFLLEKFQCVYNDMLVNLFTDYNRTKLTLADTINITTDQLHSLYLLFEELERIPDALDDTYDESNEEYNTELEIIKELSNNIDIEWFKSAISYGGELFSLVDFDEEKEALNILQTKNIYDANEEKLDFYAQKSIDEANSELHSLRDNFIAIEDDFISGFNTILSNLNQIIEFTEKWKPLKINSEIDNT